MWLNLFVYLNTHSKHHMHCCHIRARIHTHTHIQLQLIHTVLNMIHKRLHGTVKWGSWYSKVTTVRTSYAQRWWPKKGNLIHNIALRREIKSITTKNNLPTICTCCYNWPDLLTPLPSIDKVHIYEYPGRLMPARAHYWVFWIPLTSNTLYIIYWNLLPNYNYKN